MPPMLSWTPWSPSSTLVLPRKCLPAPCTPWWSGTQMQPSDVAAVAPPPRPWPLSNQLCRHADRALLYGPRRSGLCDRLQWSDLARDLTAPAAPALLVWAVQASPPLKGCFLKHPPRRRPRPLHPPTNRVTCSSNLPAVKNIVDSEWYQHGPIGCLYINNKRQHPFCPNISPLILYKVRLLLLVSAYTAWKQVTVLFNSDYITQK